MAMTWKASSELAPSSASTEKAKDTATISTSDTMGVRKRGCRRVNTGGIRWSQAATMGRRLVSATIIAYCAMVPMAKAMLVNWPSNWAGLKRPLPAPNPAPSNCAIGPFRSIDAAGV